MKLSYWVLAITLICMLISAGCQSGTPSSTNTPGSSPTPVTYIDDLGRSVTIKSYPQRIISLSPSNTEMVFALGLEDRLIGVTTYDNYPEAAKSKPQVSEYSIVDIEKIVALQPDLILADEIHKSDVVPALEKLGITVLVIRPGKIDDIISDIELLGKITGNTKQAGDLAANMRQRVKAVTDKSIQLTAAQKPSVLYVTWHDPIWTAGGNVIISDLLNMVGATNIASDLDGYATITLETVIERNPKVMVVMSSMGDQNASFDYIKQEPRLQATDALKNNQVYIIDADIFGRTSPRIVNGLEELAKITHPELFK
jgi:iron complex transport system substrate-binding protein